jgi:putative phosphotransacetylase
VGATQIADRFERHQITPNGGERSIHVMGQFIKRRKFNALKIDFNAVFALFCRHYFNSLEYYEQFCNKNVDLSSKYVKFNQNLMEAVASTPHRAVVEHLVRRAVYARLGKPLPQVAVASNPLVVNVSARHCHLTAEAVEILFGKGHQLTVHKWLYQEGQFAAKETVTLIGPRSRVISNLRIVGPCRNSNQVELAYSDAVALGFNIPMRLSGNIQDAPGAMLMGPNGFFEIDHGVIRAMRHVHMSPTDAEFYGVKSGDVLKLKIGGECGIILDKIVCRVDAKFKLEANIDTDEGNACHLQPETPVELFR